MSGLACATPAAPNRPAAAAARAATRRNIFSLQRERQSMMRKSVQRFSEKIMLNQTCGAIVFATIAILVFAFREMKACRLPKRSPWPLHGHDRQDYALPALVRVNESETRLASF